MSLWSHSSSPCHFVQYTTHDWLDLFIPSFRTAMNQRRWFACIGPSVWNRFPSVAHSSILSNSHSSHFKSWLFSWIPRTGSASERLVLKESLYKWPNTTHWDNIICVDTVYYRTSISFLRNYIRTRFSPNLILLQQPNTRTLYSFYSYANNYMQ